METMTKPDKILGFVTSFHQSMQENQLVLVYNGEINQIVTKAFTSFVERDLDRIHEILSIKKRVYHVMVECLQNISKHADEINEPMFAKGIFMVGKNQDEYSITTGNPISIEKQRDIEELINQINGKTPEELKEMRKQKMRSELSEKGGAGLGLIDIARKTQNQIFSKFIPLNENKTFFVLNVNIQRS